MQTHAQLHARAIAAGVPESVWAQLHPEWWVDECAADPALLYEIEIPIARLLGCSIYVARDPSVPLPPFDPARYAEVRPCPEGWSLGWQIECLDDLTGELDFEFGKGVCL